MAASARVVDEDRRVRGVDQALDVVGVRQIGGNEARATAGVGDGPPATVLVDIRHHHLRAGGDERQRDRAAGADARPGDDCHLTRDVHPDTL
jgi:hypothetical protein